MHRPLAKGFCDLTIGNMAWIKADSALTKCWLMCQGEWEPLGSGSGSSALFFPQFVVSCKHMHTRMLQLLEWPSSLTSYKAHGRNAEVRISESILQGDTINMTLWSSPRFSHCNFLDSSTADFPVTGPNPNYMFTQPTWNSGCDECVFSFWDKSWFSSSRQSFKSKPCLHIGPGCVERS